MKNIKLLAALLSIALITTACAGKTGNSTSTSSESVSSVVGESSSQSDSTSSASSEDVESTEVPSGEVNNEEGISVADGAWIDTGKNQRGEPYQYSNLAAMDDSKWTLLANDPDSEVNYHSVDVFQTKGLDIEGPQPNALSYGVSEYKQMLKNQDIIPAPDAATAEDSTIFTGHKVYLYTDGTYARLIFNGTNLVKLETDDALSKEDNALLLEEASPLRLYVFNSQALLDKANQEWADGQAILNGDSPEIENRIIMNGRLLSEDTKFTVDSDGNVIIPAADLANKYNSSAYITFPYEQLMFRDMFQYYCIPSEYTVNFDVEADRCRLYGYQVNADGKTCTFTGASSGVDYIFNIPDETFKMKAEDFAHLTGWKFYYDGTMLNIVTEKYEATNNFILKPEEEEPDTYIIIDDRIVTTYDKDGNVISVEYCDDDGNFIKVE